MQELVHVGGPTIFYNDFSLTRINLGLHTFLLNRFPNRFLIVSSWTAA